VPLPCLMPAALALLLLLLLLLLATPPADACACARLRSVTPAPRAERSRPPQEPVRPVVRAGGRGRGCGAPVSIRELSKRLAAPSCCLNLINSINA
jgi:hypothetical protein